MPQCVRKVYLSLMGNSELLLSNIASLYPFGRPHAPPCGSCTCASGSGICVGRHVDLPLAEQAVHQGYNTLTTRSVKPLSPRTTLSLADAEIFSRTSSSRRRMSVGLS